MSGSLFVKQIGKGFEHTEKRKRGDEYGYLIQERLFWIAIVLAVVSREKEGTYGYKITQDVRKVIDISDSTLYPVLRRLQKISAHGL